MSEERNTPEIRFEKFNDEWEKHRLSSLLNFSNGINASKESYGKGRKMISVMDILDDEVMTYNNIRNSVDVDKNIEDNNKVENEDLVFVRSSETINEVGWTKAYLDKRYVLFSGFTIRGKKKNNFDSFFLELTINNKSRNDIESKAGGSTRFNVGQSTLNKVEVNLPDISEQGKISKLFMALGYNIQKRELELTRLFNFKQAMLQKMFPKEGERVPEVRFKGFEGEWGVTTLNDIMSITTGSLDANKATPHGKYKFFTTSSEPLSIDTYAFEGPSIVLAGNGVMGKSIYVPGNEKFNAYQRVYVLKDSTNSIAYRFIQYCINQYLPKAIKKKSSGSVISYITIDVLKDLQIYLPTNEEQKLIGEYFQTLDENIQAKQKELEKLKQFKQAMLDKMFV